MRGNITILLYISALFLLSQCSYHNRFENEFQNFVSDSDKILFDGDELHPAYAYLKAGKLKGIEFNGHPECGNYTKRYFFSQNEEASRIILEKDFNESCGKAFDSIYVIDPIRNKIVVYTKFTAGKEISNNLLQSEKINIDRYKIEIKNWKNR